ncbi:Crp/Fnr family transcriptional regulator [Mucilaginibacter sp. SG564]|uniref:Crp/Fnr family transcriptional regulator n=1 Tax=Mucilaginibacter sp. SG564 TaxID=2587022 RepID=UPI001553583A|nr:Crp/Fnr family transcriptional regulator [Mucilaginibacter sp. SG564]
MKNRKEFYEPFINFMKQTVEVDQETVTMVATHSREITISKKQFVLMENDFCNRVLFIVSGKAKSYYTNPNGKTSNWMFHFNDENSNPKNLFLVDYKSFLGNVPSSVSIVSLTEIKAILFTREQIKFLKEYSASYAKWLSLLNEAAFVITYNRVFSLLALSAKERYEKLLLEEPYLLQLFSNYDVASYLGLAPQSLSRISAQSKYKVHI